MIYQGQAPKQHLGFPLVKNLQNGLTTHKNLFKVTPSDITLISFNCLIKEIENMKKTINRNNLHIGQLVAVSTHPEGQVYAICAVEGNNVLLQWREGKSQTRCTHDRDGLYAPTLDQIEYTIEFVGALVTRTDIENWKSKTTQCVPTKCARQDSCWSKPQSWEWMSQGTAN
jgi:hypothetical protein